MEIDLKISNIGLINKKVLINQKVFDELTKTSDKLAQCQKNRKKEAKLIHETMNDLKVDMVADDIQCLPDAI